MTFARWLKQDTERYVVIQHLGLNDWKHGSTNKHKYKQSCISTLH